MRKNIIIICLLILLPAMALTAQNAVLARVTGQVKISADSRTWTAARQGDRVTPGTIISTGFKSTALVKTTDAEIEVAQLTRLTLEELTRRGDTVQTTLFLNGGRINTEVSRENVRQDFTVRSPIATASVRGTGFSFDGRNLEVKHGSVLMQSGGRGVLTQKGDKITLGGSGQPESRSGAMKKQTEVKAVLALDSEDEEDLVTGGSSILDQLLGRIGSATVTMYLH
jgi:hypothetical protein